MHILFLSHYFPPEVNAPATRTYEHCRRWVAAGHRVTVVTSAPNCPNGVVFDGYRNAWRQEAEIDGIRVIRVWTYLSPNAGFLGRILNYLSYLFSATLCAVWLRRVDAVVATSPQFFCGWAGVCCRWFRRWPFVLEVRDIWPESIVAVGAMRRSPLIRILTWLEKRLYAAADRIVTVGDGYRRNLLARGVPSDKMCVVPNGVDLSQFQPGDVCTDLRDAWNSTGKFVCTYVGTVGMAHGLEVVLEAAAQLQAHGRTNVMFWIVGDGAERQRLENDARRRRLSNVRFTGMVSKHKIRDVISSSDACLVHLRRSELFGTVIPSKIFEVMAMNVPIIMGVCGQAQDIVLEAQAGVAMRPEDADSLIDCIEKIAANPGEFRTGRALVQRDYNRDRLAEQMLDSIRLVSIEKHPHPDRRQSRDETTASTSQKAA